MNLKYSKNNYLMRSWTSEVEIQGNKYLRYDKDCQRRLCRSIPPAKAKERLVTTAPSTTDTFMDHLPGTILRTW